MISYLLQAPQGGGTFQLVMLGGIILVFWFFMIRPQAKKAKEQKKFNRGRIDFRQIVLEQYLQVQQ